MSKASSFAALSQSHMRSQKWCPVAYNIGKAKHNEIQAPKENSYIAQQYPKGYHFNIGCSKQI